MQAYVTITVFFYFKGRDGRLVFEDDEDFNPLVDPTYMINIVAFFQASNRISLINECSIIAERWKWDDEKIRELPTNRRREYLEVILDLYEKEKEAMKNK